MLRNKRVHSIQREKGCKILHSFESGFSMKLHRNDRRLRVTVNQSEVFGCYWLCLQVDLIIWKWASDGRRLVFQYVLPRAIIKKVLQELHDSYSGGHYGVNRTLLRDRERFYCGRVLQVMRLVFIKEESENPNTRKSKIVHITRILGQNMSESFRLTILDNKYLVMVIDNFSK